ncbi:uncharacterized protein [Venturia canescens]|uniref:uncharacterized protein n=1 Tax=Venturia canescens TaxID=32260 RepID=UPI001C9D09DB|nr:uncharacterized protein LOC122418977 [Venturia canescens]
MEHLRLFALVIGLQFICSVYSRSLDSDSCAPKSGVCIKQITEPRTLSEGPHWDVENQVLYFVDIPKQTLHCYDPATGKVTSAYIKNGQLGVAVPVAGKKNTFVGGAGTDFVQINWDPKTNNSDPGIKVLATVDTDRRGTRFNDGKIDPVGRFWGGTVGLKEERGVASLYKIGSDDVPQRMVSPVTISNGLAWSNDNKTFYYIDSPTRQVAAYDYDNEGGKISNKRIAFDFKTNNVSGTPDGMTIDSAGNVWVACYDGGKVISVDPNTGKLLRTVEMPARQVTSVAFGGPNLDILFVTTGKQGLKSKDLVSQPKAGSVFAVEGLNVSGPPMHGFRMALEADSCSMKPGISIEPISEPQTLTEGPHWDIDDQVLYFVDIPKQTLFCYDPATGKVTNAYIKNGQLGVAIPVSGKKNTFVGGAGTDFVQIVWDPKTNNTEPDVKVLATVDTDRNGTRFNDGKIDPKGRFWAGTMGIELEPELGSLYRIGSDNVPKNMISPVSISNGLVWSHDNKTFYYIDSPTLQVWAYDYDLETGEISKKRVVFDYKSLNLPGLPDGMTIDTDGNLWIAIYDGARVISIDPKSGKLLRTLKIPAKQVTSVAFGGPNLDTLFVTTARVGLKSEDLKSQPKAGSVFAVKGLNVSGKPMLRFQM